MITNFNGGFVEDEAPLVGGVDGGTRILIGLGAVGSGDLIWGMGLVSGSGALGDVIFGGELGLVNGLGVANVNLGVGMEVGMGVSGIVLVNGFNFSSCWGVSVIGSGCSSFLLKM